MKDVFNHGEEAGCLPKDGFNSKSDEEGGQKSQIIGDLKHTYLNSYFLVKIATKVT